MGPESLRLLFECLDCLRVGLVPACEDLRGQLRWIPMNWLADGAYSTSRRRFLASRRLSQTIPRVRKNGGMPRRHEESEPNDFPVVEDKPRGESSR